METKEKGAGLGSIWRLIPHGRRRGAAWVTAGSVALALLDLAGVAALVSVLLLVLDENAVAGGVLGRIYGALGFSSVNSFITAVCVAVLVVIAAKSALSLWISNGIKKYTLSLYGHYSARMLDTYLSKGLLFIRSQHTSQFVNNINGVCLRFTDGVVGQLLMILSEAVLLLFIMVVLLVYDPIIVALAVTVFLPLALVYSRVFRRKMIENGKAENALFVHQNKTLYESLRGYSDIEINNAERYVSGKYRRGLDELARYRRKAAIVRQASGNVVEFSLVLGVVLMIIVGLSVGEPMASLKVSLGVFAIAAYKIVPAVSRMVNGWVEYRRNSYTADILREAIADAPGANPERGTAKKLPFREEIKLDNVSFSYSDGKEVLKDFSLSIRKGERIGFRGYSGAGKSTLFNIVCGFFPPQQGRLTVDGTEITGANLRMWQNNLAYVSQDLFLPDMTIAENIALGTDPKDIDRGRLTEAMRAASLAEFIGSLPDGADTLTGESGCRLSGGQRQRIGIARALYKEASVLLFDEATSSLDSNTEDEIIAAIEKLSAADRDLTILIISHRDRTLSFCDRIVDFPSQAGSSE